MLKKIVAALILGIIGIALFVFYQQSVASTPMGEYAAAPTIDVKLDMLNIDIASSPDDKIHIQLEGYNIDETMLAIREDGNRLTIEEKPRKKGWMNSFHFRSQPTIMVQLPKSTSKTVTLTNNDGNTSIQDLALDAIQAKTSTGVAYVKDVSVTEATFHTNDGNVTIAKSTIDHLDIKTSAGDVAVKDSIGTTHTIQTDDGQIKLTEATEQPNVTVKNKSGDIMVHYKASPVSLHIMAESEDVDIALPQYDQKTHMIGDGENRLSAETKDGVVVVTTSD
jgi:DUF4097 and DUF4098 domain-containing protein YvlB